MGKTSMFPEQVFVFEEDDQCPECGHVWSHDSQFHFPDCEYHSDNQSWGERFFGSVPVGQPDWSRFEMNNSEESTD